jgi:hypothetical protein
MPLAVRLLRVALACATIVLLLGPLAGCDDPPNTQRLPIGQRCTDDPSCGTSPYACQTMGYPGGYCDKACATDGDCPLDSVCATIVARCRRKCGDANGAPDPTKCRQTEGYTCRATGAIAPFCDLPGSGS